MQDIVLVKLTLYPCGNYNGADMVDYKIITLKTAEILKKHISKHKDTGFSFYCGFDCDSSLENVHIYIYDDPLIINSYQFLKINHVIGDNNYYDGSYYIYHLVVGSLMNYNRDDYDDYDNVTEQEIWEKWESIESIENV